VNDVEICFPFRSSNLGKNQANRGAAEAPCSLRRLLGSELHSVLCSRFSETLRLQKLLEMLENGVFSHIGLIFILLFLFYRIPCFPPDILNTARNL